MLQMQNIKSGKKLFHASLTGVVDTANATKLTFLNRSTRIWINPFSKREVRMLVGKPINTDIHGTGLQRIMHKPKRGNNVSR